MSDPETMPADIHPEVELLPWYVNGTLEEAERSLVARHLESCTACHRELEELVDVKSRLQSMYARQFGPSADLARSVMARITKEGTGRHTREHHKTSWLDGVDHWCRTLFMPRWVPTLAAVLLVAQMALLVWVTVPSGEREAVSTRSVGPQVARRTMVAVVFQASATEAQIRSLLRGIQGRLVDGPTEEGLFMISLPTSDGSAAASLAVLKERHDVVYSAELVTPKP
jgi:anti-sigma factor RsiW